ncbi:hypothetical protein D0T87_01350 [Bacteroides sp. 51]|nr:hypothetical protein [Bacteroides sp. 51]
MWVPDDEYNIRWLPIKEQIFSGSKYPQMIFNPEYHLYGITSTGLLVKEEIEILQECFQLSHIEEEFILIIEDEHGERSSPKIKLRLPINQPWYKTLPHTKSLEEIILEEFQLTTGCYCVFGSNGIWAKYVAIDLVDMDMDIWAFKDKALMDLFKDRHRDFPDNINKEFMDMLPKEYGRIEL